MAPPAKKRRTRAAAAAEAAAEDHQSDEQPQEQPKQTDAGREGQENTPQTTSQTPAEESEPIVEEQKAESSSANSTQDAAQRAKDRMARFKALQARAKSSSETNVSEAIKESQRLATDTSQLTALQRKHDIAAHKLLKAEIEDAGEDFERKRAWDWTIDESEKWDKRLKKKAAARDNTSFRDNQQESNKVYKRQLKNMAPDMEAYQKQKMAAIEKSAAAGGLDIVETEDGELIAIDKDGSFYSTADSTSFTQNKPDKANVDRLVADLRRAEEQRLKKRKERMAKNGDDGDVTYINEKNKQFNQKLARFYDKYTAEIRDSFERGTMI